MCMMDGIVCFCIKSSHYKSIIQNKINNIDRTEVI